MCIPFGGQLTTTSDNFRPIVPKWKKVSRIPVLYVNSSTGCIDASCAVKSPLSVEGGLYDCRVGRLNREPYSINIWQVSVRCGEIVTTVTEDCNDCSIDQVYVSAVMNAVRKLYGQKPLLI